MLFRSVWSVFLLCNYLIYIDKFVFLSSLVVVLTALAGTLKDVD